MKKIEIDISSFKYDSTQVNNESLVTALYQKSLLDSPTMYRDFLVLAYRTANDANGFVDLLDFELLPKMSKHLKSLEATYSDYHGVRTAYHRYQVKLEIVKKLTLNHALRKDSYLQVELPRRSLEETIKLNNVDLMKNPIDEHFNSKCWSLFDYLNENYNRRFKNKYVFIWFYLDEVSKVQDDLLFNIGQQEYRQLIFELIGINFEKMQRTNSWKNQREVLAQLHRNFESNYTN